MAQTDLEARRQNAAQTTADKIKGRRDDVLRRIKQAARDLIGEASGDVDKAREIWAEAFTEVTAEK